MKRLLMGLVFVGITTSCVDRHGAIESIFRLRDNSPLPSWFVLPEGMSRTQVSVKIILYNSPKARIVVRDKRRWVFDKIQDQTGEEYWHPDSLRKNPPGATYPHWVIIEVNGTKDVYEQSEPNDLLKIVKKAPQ